MATTIPIPTLAPPTDTTVLTGLWTASLSAPDRGSMATMAAATIAGRGPITDGGATVDPITGTAVTMAVVITDGLVMVLMTADSLAVPATLIMAVSPAEASAAATASMVVAASAAAEAASTAAVDTAGIANRDQAKTSKLHGASEYAVRRRFSRNTRRETFVTLRIAETAAPMLS
jgi:hypothetical protein